MKRLSFILAFLLCLAPASSFGALSVTYGLVGGVSTFTVTGTGLLMNDVIREILTHPGWYNATGAGVSVYVDKAGTNSAVSDYYFWAKIKTGDDSTATDLTISSGETLRFADKYYPYVMNNATLQFGELGTLYGYKGANISFDDYSSGTIIDFTPSGKTTNKFYCYNSRIQFGSNCRPVWYSGTIDIKNSSLNHKLSYGSGSREMYFNPSIGSLTMERVDIIDINLYPKKSGVFNDVLLVQTYLANNQTDTRITISNIKISDPKNGIDFSIGGSNAHFIFIDPDYAFDGTKTITQDNSTALIGYTIDPIISMEGGLPISGATVIFRDRSGVSTLSYESSVTGAFLPSGATDYISAVSYYSTAETKGYYNPYTITIEKAGYQTVTLSGVTIDAPLTNFPVQMIPISAYLYPEQGDVESGVSYAGSFIGGPFTGTFIVPTEAQVESGITFGSGGTEFTGSLVGGTEFMDTEGNYYILLDDSLLQRLN